MRKRIEIVFLKDVENIGKRGELKSVALGYYNNFLVPKKIVALAKSKLGVRLNQQYQDKQKEIEEKQLKLKEEFGKINGKLIKLKTATKKDVVDAINKDFKINIKPTQVHIAKKPKKGDIIKVVLAPGVRAEMKIG